MRIERIIDFGLFYQGGLAALNVIVIIIAFIAFIAIIIARTLSAELLAEVQPISFCQKNEWIE